MRVRQEIVTLDPARLIESWITDKLPFVQDLHQRALSGVLQDSLDVLVSMLVGNPDWVTVPENPVADALFSVLWYDNMDDLVVEAVREYLISGLGGVAVTPLGIEVVHPLNFVAMPSYHDRDVSVHVVTMPAARAKTIFREFVKIDENAYDWGSERGLSELMGHRRSHVYAAYQEKYIDILEVYTEGEFRYYTMRNELLGEPVEALPFEGYYLLLGDPRPLMLGHFSPAGSDGIPIGMVEKICAMSGEASRTDGDLDVVKALESVQKAIVALAKRQALLFVRKGAVTDERMVSLLENNYRVIWTSDNENSIETTDKPTIADLQIARQMLMEQLISRTGVSSYQRGVPAPGVNMATEAALLQANSNVRVGRLQVKALRWLTLLSDAYRNFLIRLMPELQKPVTVTVNGETFTFGIGNPYATVLEGVTIQPATGGFSDIMQRRQELMGALQAASLAPGRYDTGRLADALLMTYRVDPATFRAPQEMAGIPPEDLARLLSGMEAPSDVTEQQEV